MKCPKCGYLGFERVERCRNCGYEFSLAKPAPLPELPIRTDSGQLGPLEDLSLVDPSRSVEPLRPLKRVNPDLDRVFGSIQDFTPAALPLFPALAGDDQPLITKPSAPRSPLSVRRATPEVSRIRATRLRTPSLGLALDGDASETVGASQQASVRPLERDGSPRAEWESVADAGVVARLMAVALDLVVLGVIDIIVIYFTMQICGVGVAELGILPKWPLCAFLLLQNGGYLVAFTAGGQTLGKMAVGIKVVPDQSLSQVDLSRAVARAVMWLMLAVPAGLGFLTVFSRGHRGLHDRLAGTRVVR